MFKKISFFLLSFMFLALFSVSTTLAKNDKPKKDKNTPNRSERALEQHERNAQRQEAKQEEREEAKGPKGPKGGPSGQNGSSFMGKLYFFPEEFVFEDGEEDTQEEPLDSESEEDGIDEENDVLDIPWGKMNYNREGPYFKFVFNGHRLVEDTDYTLGYLPSSVIEDETRWMYCLGSDMSDEFGNVHMNERLYSLCDLPFSDDTNDGAQIILFPTGNFVCEDNAMVEMDDWDPASYLFGIVLINFHNTNTTTCPYDDAIPEE